MYMCINIISFQTQLVNDAECICSKLCFFTELDRVSSVRMLIPIDSIFMV